MAKLNIRIRIKEKIGLKKNPGKHTIDDLSTTDETYLILGKRGQGTDGNVEIRDAASSNNADVININNNPVNATDTIYFRLGDALAAMIARFARLKIILSAGTGDQRGEEWIMIKNVDDGGVVWKDSNSRLVFSDPKIGLGDVEINVMDNEPATVGNPKLSTVNANDGLKNDLSAWKEELLNLQKNLLSGFLLSTTEREDLSKVDKSLFSYLKEFQDPTNAAGGLNQLGTNTKQIIAIKQTIYRLSVDGIAEDYKRDIDLATSILEELVFWRDELGFETVKDVLKANANGFTITKRFLWPSQIQSTLPVGIGLRTGASWDDKYIGTLDATKSGVLSDNDNKTAIKGIITNKKYRGFDITSETQVEKSPVPFIVNNRATSRTITNVNEVLFDRAFEASPTLSKTNIDIFRTVFHDTTKSKKEDFRGFSLQESADFTVVTLATDAKDSTNAIYLGKNIFDPALKIQGRLDGKKIDATNVATEYKNDNSKFTKSVFDLTTLAATKEQQINAFFTTDFDTAVGTKKNVLDLMFIAIQDSSWNSYDYQNAPDNDKKEITDAYDVMKSFLVVYDVDYSTYDDSRKTELDTAYEELVKFEKATSGKYFINKVSYWTKMIDDKKTEIHRASRTEKPKPAPGRKLTPADINTARDGLVLTSSAEVQTEIKKMYDSGNHADIITGGQPLLDEMKKLAELIDKAFENGKDEKKSTLQAIRDDKTGQGSKAWELAEAIKDTNGKGLATRALDLAKKEKDNKDAELAAAKTEAKTKMKAKMTNGGEDAYNKIIKDSTTLTSKKLVDDAVRIFEKCCDAWKETKENDTLRNELAGYESATSGDKQIVWKAINSFKKNANNETDNDGFGKGALKHLQGFVKERKKIIEKSGIDKSGDEASTNASIEMLEKEKSKDPKIESMVIPRAKLMAELFKKGDDKSKELALLVRDNFISCLETDYDDSTYDANLKKLEEKLEELNEFKSGGKKEVYAGLGTDSKETFDALITSIKKKVDDMRKEKEKFEEKNDEEVSKPFFKSWKGILLIGVIIVVVLGAIAYFIKTNSSEEGEGE